DLAPRGHVRRRSLFLPTESYITTALATNHADAPSGSRGALTIASPMGAGIGDRADGRGSPGRLSPRRSRVVNRRPEEDVMESVPLLDCAGRRRSPATLSSFHQGRSPRNKGLRYPADPPTVEQINGVMRAAG